MTTHIVRICNTQCGSLNTMLYVTMLPCCWQYYLDIISRSLHPSHDVILPLLILVQYYQPSQILVQCYTTFADTGTALPTFADTGTMLHKLCRYWYNITNLCRYWYNVTQPSQKLVQCYMTYSNKSKVTLLPKLLWRALLFDYHSQYTHSIPRSIPYGKLSQRHIIRKL